jgi:hypothetical protein
MADHGITLFAAELKLLESLKRKARVRPVEPYKGRRK